MGRDLVVSPLQRHTPVRAVPSAERDPKIAPCGGTPLMGFIDSSPSPTRLPLRPLPDEPSLILRLETARSRARSVLAVPPGFDGLLRSETRSEDLVSWQLAGLLHPAASRGVHHVSGFLESEDSAALHPGGARVAGSRSLWRIPFEAFPSPVAALCHRGPPRSPEGLCPLVVPISICVSPRTSKSPTSRPCSTEESVLVAQPCGHARVDAPMGFWIDHVPACHAFRAGGVQGPAFAPWAFARGAFPRPESLGRQSFSALSGSEDPCCRRTRRFGDHRYRPLAARRLLRFYTARTPGGAWDRSKVHWLDPKAEPWPRRRRIPKDVPTTRARPEGRRISSQRISAYRLIPEGTVLTR